MPVGKLATLKSGGRAAVSADAEASPFQVPSVHKGEGAASVFSFLG